MLLISLNDVLVHKIGSFMSVMKNKETSREKGGSPSGSPYSLLSHPNLTPTSHLPCPFYYTAFLQEKKLKEVFCWITLYYITGCKKIQGRDPALSPVMAKAPAGHMCTQRVHSVQRSSLMTRSIGYSSMAAGGQTATQAPHSPHRVWSTRTLREIFAFTISCITSKLYYSYSFEPKCFLTTSNASDILAISLPPAWAR